MTDSATIFIGTDVSIYSKVLEKDDVRFIHVNELGKNPFEDAHYVDIVAPLKIAKEVYNAYSNVNADFTFITYALLPSYEFDEVFASRTQVVEVVEGSKICEVYGKESFVYRLPQDKNLMLNILNEVVRGGVDNIKVNELLPKYIREWLQRRISRMVWWNASTFRMCLNHYSKLFNTTFTSDDVEFFGVGGFNVVLHVKGKDEVLRINQDPNVFNTKAYALLDENSGFVQVIACYEKKRMRYCRVPILKPIEYNNVNSTKMKNCVSKVINFLRNHKEYAFTDCYVGNFMQSSTDYYVSDIDISMYEEKYPTPTLELYEKHNAEGIPTKISYNYNLYANIGAKFNIPLTNFSTSLMALTLFELSGWRNQIIITKEVEDKLMVALRKEKEW